VPRGVTIAVHVGVVLNVSPEYALGLKLGDGKIEKVRELVELAKIDWRDLIMVAEYEVTEGKIVLNARGQSRLAEIAMRKRQRTADGE
jgi:hypothetical protein